MATREELSFPDRTGTRTVRGTLSRPPVAKAPGVVLIPEWWGLNDDLRGLADRFAEAGFLALAVDVYQGRSTTDPAEARTLMEALQTPVALDEIGGAVARLAGDAGCTGKVGVTGFCLGGGLALAAACSVEGLGAAVAFYGLPRAEHADWAREKVPVQGHYGRRDAGYAPERVDPIWKDMAAKGMRAELHWYDAGHAFMRAADPRVYDRASAELAWGRTVAFFQKTLG